MKEYNTAITTECAKDKVGVKPTLPTLAVVDLPNFTPTNVNPLVVLPAVDPNQQAEPKLSDFTAKEVAVPDFDPSTYKNLPATAIVTPAAVLGAKDAAAPAKPTPTVPNVAARTVIAQPNGKPTGDPLPGIYKPSEAEMEAYYAPLLECPAAYVPIDLPPSKADAGSFKGYSNRWTYHSVGGEYDLDTAGKTVKYDNMSESLNMFTSSATLGCIIGFAVFGLGIMYAVVMIAVDMKRRLAMYEDLIADDVAKMSAMGL